MTANSDQSDLSPLLSAPVPGGTPPQRPVPLDLWLDGEVVACGCPECGAPMSIRMWLKLADCFRCATSIELTEDLVEEIERLGQAGRTGNLRDAAGSVAKDGRSIPPPPPPVAPQDAPDMPLVVPPVRDLEVQQQRQVAAASQPIGVRRKLREMAHEGAVRVWWQGLFRDLTAWLTSAVLHLVALLILALIVMELSKNKSDPFITLSTEIDRKVREGGETMTLPNSSVDFDMLNDPNNLPPVDYDLPIDDKDVPTTRQLQIKLNQEARELRIDPGTPVPNAPTLFSVKSAIASADPDRRAYAVRDPRVRAELVRKEGGTTMTEAAVSRGLRWLAMHQHEKGNWSLDRFDQAEGCHGSCGGLGNLSSDPGATALALLPFLGAGQTHLVGKYQSNVSSGLKYLISIQKENGDLRGNSSGNSGMYAHGQATLVLCEAYKMTGDEILREPAQRGIDFVVDGQHVRGGWRYQPAYEDARQVPDTSVLGWQVMALHSAEAAYLDVPNSARQLAALYLDRAQSGHSGGLYCYEPTRSRAVKPSMTAEALLCRMMLGWKLNHPGLQEGIGYLMRRHLPSADEKPNLYYWYYGTQMMHHVGGRPWNTWNLRTRDLLVELQDKHGHSAGSWPPSVDPYHGHHGGRLYTTAFATAILEVYYRQAPLFRQIELE